MGFYAYVREESTSTSLSNNKAPRRHGSHRHPQVQLQRDHQPKHGTEEKPRASRWKRFGRAVLKGLGRGLEGLGKVVLGVGEVVLGVGLVLGKVVVAVVAGVAIAAVAAVAVPAVLAVGAVVLGVVVFALPVLLILSPVFIAYYWLWL